MLGNARKLAAARFNIRFILFHSASDQPAEAAAAANSSSSSSRVQKIAMQETEGTDDEEAG